MKAYVSVDREGVAGIVHVDQTRPDGQDYPRARELMTAEANAAALGAFDAGARQVLVNDSHGDMRNLLLDRLDPRVEIITGDSKPLSMAQGLETRYDAAMFIGYHAGMGARAGVLDHTYYGAVVSQISVNGRAVNEAALNAMVAGAHGTPVVLVSGDDRCCQEASAALPDATLVPVKWAVSRYCARSLHPAEAQRRIRAAARRAVKNARKVKPCRVDPPYALRLAFLNSGMADHAELMPGVKRVDGRTVEFETRDIHELFRAMLAAMILAMESIPKVRAR